MARITILTVVGARPQFIKAAAVSRAISASDDFREILVHTGQHFDPMMSDVFFAELNIPVPSECLNINSSSHGVMTGRMLELVEASIIKHKPDWVMVYGDTNSTLAGALAAVKLHVPVIHVEAGLRSFNRRMPEEINRVVVDHISTLLLSPTRAGVENLRTEGIVQGVHHVGDVMYDAMLYALEKAQSRPQLANVINFSSDFILATIHRAENTDDLSRLSKLIEFIRKTAAGRPILFPIHPRTRRALLRSNINTADLSLIDPVGYLDMAQLLASCELVMTDSGGLQKEAYFARRPCITLRDETEWVETIESGWNRLWTQPHWSQPRSRIDEYGNGFAARAVLDAVRGWKG